MIDETFWSLIAASRAESNGTRDGQLEALTSGLLELEPEEIVEFQRLFDEAQERAFTWDLWGAAYVILGGCGDDGFSDFRSWLISMGREHYAKSSADPEWLAEADLGEDPSENLPFEEFAYVASGAYEEKTGESMPAPNPAARRSAPSAEPRGEPWEEEGDALAKRFPRLWARYGWE